MGPPLALTIYHNPNCSTSRKVLGMVRESGRPFTVVEYLKAGWSRTELESLLTRMKGEPKDLLRTKEGLCKTMGLGLGSPPEAILQAMIAHPVLVERPILSSPKGVVVCRPPERALALI